MFHSRKLNNRINNIPEHTLRIAFRDYESTFRELLKQSKYILYLYIKIRATEIFKTKNEAHSERLVFHPIQYRNSCLAVSDLFDMFTQSIKFYTFSSQYRCLKKCDSSNRQ